MATIDQVQPRTLYRYRALAKFDRELEALEQNYLFCVAYTTLNDPMEGVFHSSKVFRESTNHRITRRDIIDNKRHIGMCSFSEVYDHELMWAHYADKYSGICIAYSFARLLDNLGDNVSFVRMYYNEDVPIVRHSRQEAEDVAKMVLSYKNYRWLYEREWRMFAPQGKAKYGDKACVSRMYLGSRIDSDKARKIIRAMKAHGIKKYSIAFEPCS